MPNVKSEIEEDAVGVVRRGLKIRTTAGVDGGSLSGETGLYEVNTGVSGYSS